MDGNTEDHQAKPKIMPRVGLPLKILDVEPQISLLQIKSHWMTMHFPLQFQLVSIQIGVVGG
jgi:hypothetical protein